MKVTLPAAMYYTGVHSQAEYNIALEGGWNFCCRSLLEPGGRVGMKGATAEFFFAFIGWICFVSLAPRYGRMVSVRKFSDCRRYREEPTVILRPENHIG